MNPVSLLREVRDLLRRVLEELEALNSNVNDIRNTTEYPITVKIEKDRVW